MISAPPRSISPAMRSRSSLPSMPAACAMLYVATVSGGGSCTRFQLNTWRERGSIVSRSHSLAVSPSTTTRMRLPARSSGRSVL